MPKTLRRRARPDVPQGTLDLLILKVLSQEPQHGYGIVRTLQAATDSVLNVEEGALYPALHRLERRGCLKGSWGRSEAGRRARYYALTAAGRRRLMEETEAWERSAGAVAKVLQLREGGGPA